MKQEMEEKGSSMSDGGETFSVCEESKSLIYLFLYETFECLCLRPSPFSSGGEDQAEFDQTEAGDRSDGRQDRRRRAHAAAGEAQGEIQHDARHARHQHPRTRRRAFRLDSPPRQKHPTQN